MESEVNHFWFPSSKANFLKERGRYTDVIFNLNDYMCFLIGVTGKGYTKNGGALLGSVSDDPYDVRTFVRSVVKEGEISHVGTELVSIGEKSLKELGYFAREGEPSRGVNDAGLAFTTALIFEREANTHAEWDFADILDVLMGKHENVNSAIEFLSTVKSAAPAFTLLLADAKGEIAQVEVGGQGVKVYQRFSKENPGAIYAVNCYLSGLKEFGDPKASYKDPKNNNRIRRERGKELLKKYLGEVDVQVIAKILSDHENQKIDPLSNPLLEAWGYSICNHGTRKDAGGDLPWGTVSAEILEPSTKTLWYNYGWPCGQKPQFEDQKLQENSWGKFIPFKISNLQKKEVEILVNAEGLRNFGKD